MNGRRTGERRDQGAGRALRPAFAALAAAAVLTFALSAPAPPAAAVVIVDHAGGGDYDNIQAGVDAASEGDTVLVYPGTYDGPGDHDIEFGAKNVVLRSRDGAVATIIHNAYGAGHRLLRFFDGGQDTTCVVDGFTLKHGSIVGATDSGGGAISVDGVSNPPGPKFVNLVIEYNYGWHGGGVYVNSPEDAARPVFRSCVFRGNTATNNGGAIYCGTGAEPRVYDCTFEDNESASGMGGGVHCNLRSDAEVARCLFDGNTAGARGGALSAWRSDIVVTECTLVGNSSQDVGGAVSCRGDCSPLFSNLTVARSSANGEGGAVWVMDESTPVFQNTIVAFTEDARGDAVACDATGAPTFDTCCVFGNHGGDALCGAASNIIYQNPEFCNLDAGDLTLAATSPCLPPGNPYASRIGAHDEGCSNPAVRPVTWGLVKFLHR